jgi:hypothetical protein
MFWTLVGYRAIAINSTFNGSAFDSKKKKKKGEVQEKRDMIPPPANQDIIKVSVFQLCYKEWKHTIVDDGHKLIRQYTLPSINELYIVIYKL